MKDTKHRTYHLYIASTYVEMFGRLEKLAEENKISLNNLICATLDACSETLHKQIPKKRSFDLEGAKIVV